MALFYMIWKKYNEIQLTKNKLDLNYRKITNHPPSPEVFEQYYWTSRVALDARVARGQATYFGEIY